MLKRALIVMFLVWITAPAFAQQQTPAEIIDALNMKVGMLEQNLNQLYLAVAKQKALIEAGDERAKWVLDNWCKSLDNKTDAK